MFSRDDESLAWSSFNILYDDSLSTSLANMIHKKLSHNAVVSMISVPSMADIGALLKKVPGKNFLVIIRKHLVEQFIKAVSLKTNQGPQNCMYFIRPRLGTWQT